MRPLREPPIRWEMYLVALVVGVSTYTVSTAGIRCQVDRLREVTDRLESLAVMSQINDQTVHISGGESGRDQRIRDIISGDLVPAESFHIQQVTNGATDR